MANHHLAVKLTVLCSGADAGGRKFEERTRTTAITAEGGRLLTAQKLQPGARLTLRLLARPDRTAEIKLGKALESRGEQAEWAFEFAGPAEDFWGVRFKDATGDAAAPVQAIAAGTLAEISEQLVLLAAHADDHIRYCSQEMEVLKERFARELQSALDSGARQLQQLARSTMQTTFRSLLEDLAHRAEQSIDEGLARLRKSVDEATARSARDLVSEADTQFRDFQERLVKQGRQVAARAEQLQADSERTVEEALEQALSNFQAATAETLHAVADSLAVHKLVRPHHKEAKPAKTTK